MAREAPPEIEKHPPIEMESRDTRAAECILQGLGEPCYCRPWPLDMIPVCGNTCPLQTCLFNPRLL